MPLIYSAVRVNQAQMMQMPKDQLNAIVRARLHDSLTHHILDNFGDEVIRSVDRSRYCTEYRLELVVCTPEELERKIREGISDMLATLIRTPPGDE